MSDTPNVSAATDAALAALTAGGFDYALIGGLAVILRGHDRYTQDVDALVWNLDDRLDELAALLSKYGFSPPSKKELRLSNSTRLRTDESRNKPVGNPYPAGGCPSVRMALVMRCKRWSARDANAG